MNETGHPVYSEIMFKGSDETPLEIDLSNDFDSKRIVIRGEGRNRHINIFLGNGWVDLLIDLHGWKDAKHYAYIASTLGVNYTGAPDVKRAMGLAWAISRHSSVYDHFWWFSKEGLDKLFDYICERL